MLCVFSISISAVGAQCGLSGRMSRRDLLPVQDPVVGVNRPHQAAGEPGRHGKLPVQQMCARDSQMTSWPCSVWILMAMVLPMVPVGTNSAGFLAEDLGRALFQPIDGRVFAIDIVADFGLRHGAAHGRGGAGDGVAAKIDHDADEFREDFVGEKNAAIGEPQSFAVLGQKAVVEETLDGRFVLRSILPAPAAMPCVSRRPTKKRSSAEIRRLGTEARDCLRESGRTYSPGEFDVLRTRWRRRRNARRLPKPTYGSSRQYFRLCSDSKPGRAKLEIS